MFNISEVVITYIQKFFKKFSGDSVAKYQSENLALLVHHISAVAERLKYVPAFTRDTPLLVLTGFNKCSVPEFFFVH